MISELEAEVDTQGSRRQRETHKPAGGRGKHTSKQEGEGSTHTKAKSKDQKGRNTGTREHKARLTQTINR